MRFLIPSSLLTLLLLAPGCSTPADPGLRAGRLGELGAETCDALAAAATDREVLHELTSGTLALMKERRATRMSDLVGQLGRTRCTLKLPEPLSRKSDAAELYKRCKPGVLIVASLSKCPKCKKWHSNTATGFLVTRDGAFVTNYHVVNHADHATMTAMTSDGRIHVVRAVLAADEANDLAILQLEGSGFTPLALSTDAPVGSAVRVISHPNNRLYTLTEGIVSRYYALRQQDATLSRMAITADFAKGSSGAPVFNEHGAVVGVATQTMSSYHDVEHGQKTNLQMVFKHCIPARVVLDLVN